MDNEKNMTDGIEVVQDESMDMSAGVLVEKENCYGTFFDVRCDSCGRFTFRPFKDWSNGRHRKMSTELDVYSGSWRCSTCDTVNDTVGVRKKVDGGKYSMTTVCVAHR